MTQVLTDVMFMLVNGAGASGGMVSINRSVISFVSRNRALYPTLGFLLFSLLLFSLGPEAQGFLYASAGSVEARFFDAAGQLQEQERFSDWLASSLSIQTIAPALVAYFVFIRSVRYRDAAIRVAIYSAITISFFDGLYIATSGDLGIADFIASVVFNFVGCAVFSCALIVLASVVGNLYEFAQDKISRAVLASLPAIIALIGCWLFFLLTRAMFFSAPVLVQADFSPGSSANFRAGFSSVSDSATEAAQESGYSFTGGGGLSVVGQSSPLSVTWASRRSFSLNVYLTSGCGFEEEPAEINGSPYLIFPDANVFSLALSPGLSSLYLSSESSMNFSFDQKDLAVISSVLEDDGEVKIAAFRAASDRLEVVDAGSSIIEVSAMLIGGDGDDTGRVQELAATPRLFVFLVDGDFHQLIIEPDQDLRRGELSECRYVSFDPSSSADRSFVALPSMIGGLVFELKEHADGRIFDNPLIQSSLIGVGGINGWAKFSTGHGGAGESVIEDRTDFLIVSGTPERFEVNGVHQASPADGTLQAVGGDFTVELRRDGRLSVSGRPLHVYWEGIRTQKTRWENLDQEIRWGVLSSLLLSVIFVFRYAFNLSKAGGVLYFRERTFRRRSERGSR